MGRPDGRGVENARAASIEGVERDTILVTHGGVCRVLRVLLLDDPIEELMRGPVPQDKVMILKSGSAEWI